MDKTKIDWCDSTWNPVTGCLHECSYCYARGIAKRFGKNYPDYTEYHRMNPQVHILDNPIDGTPYPFEFDPTFHYYRLKEYQDKKKPRNIFVCSMADLFGEWVPDDWITDVFNACKAAPQHNYLFLTKNPERYILLENTGKMPHEDNIWLGTTVTNPNMPYLWTDNKINLHTFLSIEPIMEDFGEFGADKWPEWVIIGAETGKRKGKVVPEKSWIDNLVRQCKERNIPVFMKESLRAFYGDDLLREFPKGLLHG